MSRSRRSRRHPRPRPEPPPRRPPNRKKPPAAFLWWRSLSVPVRLGLLVVLAFAVLVGVNFWVHQQPAQPDAQAVHADIQAGRSGAEVTFVGTLVDQPTNSGGHQRMEVRDRLGDMLELDYNTDLGRPVPVRQGDSMTVHGQLYIDPGKAGVHCLHSQTSRGCPEPGWIQVGGRTFS